MSLPVRAVTAADVESVVALEHEVFGVDAWSEAVVRSSLTDAFLVAVDATGDGAGGLVGYAITRVVADVADLLRIAVRPSYRRRGVATTLLAAAQEDARERGAARMLLEVSADNAGALAFYAGEGFVEIDRRLRYFRDGNDAVVMRAGLGVGACGRTGAAGAPKERSGRG